MYESDQFLDPRATSRKGVSDVGLDGTPEQIDLEVDPAYVESGLKTLAEVMKLNSEYDISDIQIQSDRYIYIATADGLRRVRGIERLNSQEVVGILLALVYNREAGIAVNDLLQKNERIALGRAMTIHRKVDFGCSGGFAAVISEIGDFALPGGRFRVQAHFSATGLGITCRILRENIITLQETGLSPDVIKSLTSLVRKRSGLGIVTGATGSGKTTTLASLVEWIRVNTNKHIVTIEDPIEYRYPDTVSIRGRSEEPSDSLVTQQEVGRDVLSFQQGLEDALRKKPDIILMGEIRDKETMKICLNAAQTGHLVLTTLHTRGAIKTLSRLLELATGDDNTPTMTRVSDVLLFILSQGLLPPAQMDGGKRVLAIEYLQIEDTAGKNAIKNYGTAPAAIQDHMSKAGNVRWEDSLKKLKDMRQISDEIHREASLDENVRPRGES